MERWVWGTASGNYSISCDSKYSFNMQYADAVHLLPFPRGEPTVDMDKSINK